MNPINLSQVITSYLYNANCCAHRYCN